MEFNWTSHAKYKMNFYRLSEARFKRVISNPARVEEGIAEDTVAMLQAVTTSKKPYEIWIMINRYKKQYTIDKNSKISKQNLLQQKKIIKR